MANISEVAKLAGVSTMTVSRVMSGKGYVNENTRERVMQAVQQLGYYPNHLARGLVTKKSGIIGVLLTNMRNPVYSAMIYGINDRARESGYDILVSSCNTLAHAKQGVETMLNKQVDGMIILPIEFSEFDEHKYNMKSIDYNINWSLGFYSWLEDNILKSQEMRRKVIIAGGVLGDVTVRNVSSVDSDTMRGARLAAEYLLSKGHRRIGYIAHELDRGVWRKRTESFFLTMKAKSVPFDINYMERCQEDTNEAKKAAIRMLNAHPDITAILCANDVMAVGALFAAIELGRKVPDDLSIIGNDGTDIGELVCPRLTSVSGEFYEVGQVCVDLWKESINGAPPLQSLIEPKLVIRESVSNVL